MFGDYRLAFGHGRLEVKKIRGMKGMRQNLSLLPHLPTSTTYSSAAPLTWRDSSHRGTTIKAARISNAAIAN